MPVVEEYWTGVLRRLQAEVGIFNDLITHQGEKGRANELSLAQMISRLIPQRYAVGSGVLIDSQDSSSSQTDIVIFNQTDEPALLAQSTQVLFPIENVALCVEVKTTVGKEEIEDALSKRDSMLDLKPVTGRFPAYALVGFEGESSVDTLAKHLEDGDRRLDLALILREGIVAGNSSLLTDIRQPQDEGYKVGMTCLDPKLQQQLLAEADTRSPKSYLNYVQNDGTLYPVVRRQNREKVVTDPARALLLFCDALLRILASRGPGHTSQTPVMSHYITAEARKLVRLNQETVKPHLQ
ncbi:DUF6602 domain-containing protein [Micromonospora chersina]|uniref:DUF6602 domain-containing protein n=1 Tax=Micromonospora chersina TaxID=47854 RepID=UPI0037215865